MPDEKEKQEGKLVDIDTSGPGAEVSIPEEKKQEELEDYSKGVKSRIAKLTKRMREAERQREAALTYAKSVQGEQKLSLIHISEPTRPERIGGCGGGV